MRRVRAREIRKVVLLLGGDRAHYRRVKRAYSRERVARPAPKLKRPRPRVPVPRQSKSSSSRSSSST